jgi:hypothetical protein
MLHSTYRCVFWTMQKQAAGALGSRATAGARAAAGARDSNGAAAGSGSAAKEKGGGAS